MGLFEALRSAVRGSRVARAFSLAGAPEPQPAVYYDDSGVGVSLDPETEPNPESIVPWADIFTATVFKRDLLTVDLICLQLVTGQGSVLEVNEEMGGWSALLDSLPTYLPGCMNEQQILEAVVKPAFATNEVIVYRRVS